MAVNYARDAAAAEAVCADVRAAGRQAWAVQADVADEAQVAAMFARLDAEAPRLVGLVNNAGVVDRAQRLDEMDLARWQRIFGINVIGTLLCTRAAVRRMSSRHGGRGIQTSVSISSKAARPSPSMMSMTRWPIASMNR